MKHQLYIIPLLLLASHSLGFAQHSLQSELNRPRPGDQLIRQQVEFKEPGRVGKDVLWDFSKLTPVLTKRFVLPFSLENTAIDPNQDFSKLVQEVMSADDKIGFWEDPDGSIVESCRGELYYYNSSGDSLMVKRYAMPTTRIDYSRPELRLVFPFAYKDKMTSYFLGIGTYCESQNVDLCGSLYTEADACGMIILPNQDTLTNVLRVRSLEFITDEKTPYLLKKQEKEKEVKEKKADKEEVKEIEMNLKKSEVFRTTEVIRWYAEGYRYPVFETRHTVQQDSGTVVEESRLAFFYHPLDQEEDYLKDDPANRKLLEKQQKAGEAKVQKSQGQDGNSDLYISEVRHNIYPNPTDGELKVEVYFSGEARSRLSLYSLQGQLLYESPEETMSGVFLKTVPMYSLPSGTYILNIRCGEIVITEKIIRN